ncbi:unknown [Hungatella hathewayi CAG:224]|nr:unknown [Hungatella hathewayi CAG:224]
MRKHLLMRKMKRKKLFRLIPVIPKRRRMPEKRRMQKRLKQILKTAIAVTVIIRKQRRLRLMM